MARRAEGPRTGRAPRLAVPPRPVPLATRARRGRTAARGKGRPPPRRAHRPVQGRHRPEPLGARLEVQRRTAAARASASLRAADGKSGGPTSGPSHAARPRPRAAALGFRSPARRRGFRCAESRPRSPASRRVHAPAASSLWTGPAGRVAGPHPDLRSRCRRPFPLRQPNFLWPSLSTLGRPWGFVSYSFIFTSSLR